MLSNRAISHHAPMLLMRAMLPWSSIVADLIFKCDRCGYFDRAVFAHCTEEGVLCDDCFDVLFDSLSEDESDV
ncbi:hypothetical protein XFF7767_900061 [Xanthomonas citri pv. fuscans]|nr:hypothetical protein XFF7767_900061 [Xanthomonas citri pv. fuscans]SOO12958.1 hypothetical protein XFF7766_1150034 [Xanthomonas citri pv. fuscans]